MKTIGLIVCLVLAGCSRPTEMSRETADTIGPKMRYFQDARTGQCFAAIENSGLDLVNGLTVTWVPCDPKVLEATKQ